jgi:hypothetical protein
MYAIERQQYHHRKIGNQHHRVKGIPMVEAFECGVGVLRLEVVSPPVLRRENHAQRALETERTNPHSIGIKSI